MFTTEGQQTSFKQQQQSNSPGSAQMSLVEPFILSNKWHKGDLFVCPKKG